MNHVYKNSFYGKTKYFVQHCYMHVLCDVMIVCSPTAVKMAD